MRPLWHFVLSFTKHSVQQNPSPLDPQSNLMVLVQWHQKALLSGSLQTALCVVSLSTHTLFFSFQPANHTPWEFSVKLTGMCCLYAKSMIKWKKKRNNIFKWASNSTHYWRSSRASKQLQTSQCFLLAQSTAPPGGAVSPRRGAHYLRSLPLPRLHVSRWLLSCSERGHAYPYYTAASGLLAEACKYQKGIICCGCWHTPRQAHASQLLWRNRTSLHITWAPIIYAGVQSNDYLGTESFPKASGTIFNTTRVEGKTVRHETDERVFDSGAILSDPLEAVGAADRTMGAGDWESLLSLSFSLL